ncbi:hypothetical protein [Streptomyces sp. SA15]|uniref:hypothetical protein n=1 Tax=Streptomyces sp. SA15 TaxID=934019 RepID=UPI0027B8B960|nr:hypothetical protein [Streptomyces sp. SA15]
MVRTASALEKTSEFFFEQTVQIQNIERVQMPADVSGVVAFLASDDAAFITGRSSSRTAEARAAEGEGRSRRAEPGRGAVRRSALRRLALAASTGAPQVVGLSNKSAGKVDLVTAEEATSVGHPGSAARPSA